MDTITSLKNERVKLVYGLQNRVRTRRKERKIALEGTRVIRDAVERGQKPLFTLYEPGKADYNLIAEFQTRGVDLLPVSTEVMAHISDTNSPPGIITVFRLPVPPLPRKPRHVLILDNLRDPGNMGGIMRTAAAAGIEVVLLSPGCTDPYNPKVLRGGMGAHFRVAVVEANWDEIGGYCEPLNVYLAAGDAHTDYAAVDWTQPWALVIGSEAQGISSETEALMGKRVRIPMAAETESLNAGVAAGVILFEASRQMRVAAEG